MDRRADSVALLQVQAACSLVLILVGCALIYLQSPLFLIWGVCVLLLCAGCYRKKGELAGQIRGLFSAEAKEYFVSSFVFTAVFSFAAHGFLFANEFFSHDSITMTYYATCDFRFYAGMGRFIIPLYEVIKGFYPAPWLIGVLFTIWISLTTFLTVEFLQFKGRPAAAMVSGLLCTNTALILTGATYVYCLDEYALSLLAAVAAAYFFCKVPHGWILGVPLVVFSLAIYQTYFTVALAFCFIWAIRRMIRNEDIGRIVIDGLKQIGWLLISFGAYFVVWTATCAGLQIEKTRTGESILYEGVTGIFELVMRSYASYFKRFISTDGVLGVAFAAANIFLLILFFKAFFDFLKRRDVSGCHKLLMVVMVLCAPIVFSSSKIILAGSTTELTSYVYELAYIFLLVWWDQRGGTEGERRGIKSTQIVIAVLIGCIVYNNIVFANQAYMKKDLEKTATVSLVTRMIDRIETLEGYRPNETPVYLVGGLTASDLNNGKHDIPYLEEKVGLWFHYSATYNLVLYITDYLNYPMLISANPGLADLPEVQEMPAFPAAGSVKMIDGAAVIKVS